METKEITIEEILLQVKALKQKEKTNSESTTCFAKQSIATLAKCLSS